MPFIAQKKIYIFKSMQKSNKEYICGTLLSCTPFSFGKKVMQIMKKTVSVPKMKIQIVSLQQTPYDALCASTLMITSLI